MKEKDIGKVRVGVAQIHYKLAGFAGVEKCLDFLQEFQDFDFCKEHKEETLSEIMGKLCQNDLSSLNKIIGQTRKKIEKHYCLWISEKVNKILEKAQEYNVELIVFPELSIPAKCLPKIKEKIKDKEMVVIAGSHYIKNTDIEEGIYNQLGLSSISSDLKNLHLSPIFLDTDRVDYVIKKKIPDVEPSFVYIKDKAEKIGTGPKTFSISIDNISYRFALFICNEYLINEVREEFMTKLIKRQENTEDEKHADFFVVASSPVKPERFEDVAKRCLQEPYFLPSVIACDAEEGGSGVYATFDLDRLYDLRCKRHGVTIPSGEEALLIVDIDVKKPTRHAGHSAEGSPLPADSPIIIPLLYDENMGQKEITYQEAVERIKEDGYKYEDFVKYLPREVISQLGLKSRILQENLSRLGSDPERYKNMDNAEKHDYLQAIIFPPDIPNLFEWRYGEIFKLWLELKLLLMKGLPDVEKGEAESLLKKAEEWQKGLIERFKIRKQFIKDWSIEKTLLYPEALERITRELGVDEREVERRVDILFQEGGYNTRLHAFSVIYLEQFPEEKDKNIIWSLDEEDNEFSKYF